MRYWHEVNYEKLDLTTKILKMHQMEHTPGSILKDGSLNAGTEILNGRQVKKWRIIKEF